ncbi:hypothetical protein HXX02_16200 [Microbulbifer elongatus]|uniref:Uncharacterized protein n=1 Tax=Microbulbifer elongatus TaxID=86173 RepID=A0ABT1P4E8_9GAMM|nr:hypothetical protein [Microbulbifer elongatus]MCQ3830982.1 hypothetical protein [Microbulbifer elongatus]
MEFNSQIANWLMSALGGLASWIVIAACTLLALNIVLRARFLRQRGEGLHWLLDRSVVIRLLCLLFFIWVLIGFNSNGPKLVLAPDYSDEQEAVKRALQPKRQSVENLAPEVADSEETSERLAELRAEQKEDSQDQN